MLSFEKWVRSLPMAAIAVMLAVGCGHGGGLDSSQTAGELGNGAFRYLCVETRDALCPSGGEAKAFPERIGTTGLFDVRFEPFGSKDLAGFDIVTVAADVVEEANNLFRAKAQGKVALLAKRTSDSRVLDFVHIQVVDIAKIRFEGSKGESPRVIWLTGTLQTLRAVPLDKDGAVLAGGMAYEWATSDASIARLQRASPAAEMDLLPIKAGSVTLSVTAGGHTETLAVIVEGKSTILPDGGHGGYDGGVEAGSPDGAAPPEPDATPVEAGPGTPVDSGASPDARSTDGGLP